MTESKFEQAARAAGWTRRYSHFTRDGVSIGYVSWEVLCREEGIRVDDDKGEIEP